MPQPRRADQVRALVTVHVVPRAKANQVCGYYGDAVRIRLRAPPVDGAANAALLAFLAKVLQVSEGQLALVSGFTSRRKVVAVTGLDSAQVMARLEAGAQSHPSRD